MINQETEKNYVSYRIEKPRTHGTIGDQRTGPEIETLMVEAGFSETECRPLDHEQGIAIGWKHV